MTDPDDQDAYADLRRLLRYTREQHGLSVEALAQAAGVSTSTVFRLEAGKTVAPKPKLVAALARELSLTADDVSAAIPDDPGLAAEIASRIAGVATARVFAGLAGPAGTGTLVAFNPEGAIVNITMQHVGEQQVVQLVDCLSSLGYTVTRPV